MELLHGENKNKQTRMRFQKINNFLINFKHLDHTIKLCKENKVATLLIILWWATKFSQLINKVFCRIQ